MLAAAVLSERFDNNLSSRREPLPFSGYAQLAAEV
jgi:hypothetical protein